MRVATRSAVFALMIGVLALAGCSTASTTSSTTTSTTTTAGLGSTVARLKAAYGVDTGPGAVCTAPDSCFGPPVKNDESGKTYEFTDMTIDGGIVDGYQQNFVPGTTIAEAKADVLRLMPKDTMVVSFTIDHHGGSCGLMNLSGKSLGQTLGNPKIGDSKGYVGIEFEYANANLNIVYDPNNIQDANLGVGMDKATDSC